MKILIDKLRRFQRQYSNKEIIEVTCDRFNFPVSTSSWEIGYNFHANVTVTFEWNMGSHSYSCSQCKSNNCEHIRSIQNKYVFKRIYKRSA